MKYTKYTHANPVCPPICSLSNRSYNAPYLAMMNVDINMIILAKNNDVISSCILYTVIWSNQSTLLRVILVVWFLAAIRV